MMRLVLDEQAFRDLVAGRVAKLMTTTTTPVELILSDIGWDRMYEAIRVAQQDYVIERVDDEIAEKEKQP